MRAAEWADLWADWTGARKAASTACLKAEKSAHCLVCETVGHWGATMAAWTVCLSADQRAALRVGSWAWLLAAQKDAQWAVQTVSKMADCSAPNLDKLMAVKKGDQKAGNSVCPWAAGTGDSRAASKVCLTAAMSGSYLAFEMAGCSDRPTVDSRDGLLAALLADLWAALMVVRKAASTVCLKAEKSANCLAYLSADQRVAPKAGHWALLWVV